MNQPLPGESVITNDIERAAQQVAHLLAAEHQAMFGDENMASAIDDGAQQEEAAEETGIRRVVPFEAGGYVAVARYHESAVPSVSARIAEELQLDTNELGQVSGHIEFIYQKEPDANHIDGTVYLTSTAAIAHVTMTHDIENPISPEARRCYDIAAQLGLGETWVSSLFAFGETEQDSTELTLTLNSEQVQKVDTLLATLAINRAPEITG